MRDRVDVRRPTGDFINEGTAQVPATTTMHTNVPAWIRVLQQQSRVVDAVGATTTILAYDVLLPEHVGDIRIGDLIVVTRTAGTDLQGATLAVIEVTLGSYQVARRLVCQIQSRGL